MVLGFFYFFYKRIFDHCILWLLILIISAYDIICNATINEKLVTSRVRKYAFYLKTIFFQTYYDEDCMNIFSNVVTKTCSIIL